MGRHTPSTPGTRPADKPAGFLATVIERPLRPGDRGVLVETLRRMLVRAEVLPDAVPTEVSDTLFDDAMRAAVQTFQQRRGLVADGVVGRQTAAINCIGRSGYAEEVGEAVVFLLSDRASVITGQVIHLDGGLFARASWPTNAAPYEPPPAQTDIQP